MDINSYVATHRCDFVVSMRFIAHLLERLRHHDFQFLPTGGGGVEEATRDPWHVTGFHEQLIDDKNGELTDNPAVGISGRKLATSMPSSYSWPWHSLNRLPLPHGHSRSREGLFITQSERLRMAQALSVHALRLRLL